MSWRRAVDRGSHIGGLALWLVLTGFVGLGVLVVGVTVLTWAGHVVW